jgi:hypothetical protein
VKRRLFWLLGIVFVVAMPVSAYYILGEPTRLEFTAATGEPDLYRLEIIGAEPGKSSRWPVKLRAQARKGSDVGQWSEWSEPFYIPEPGMLLLLGSGILGLGVLNRIRGRGASSRPTASRSAPPPPDPCRGGSRSDGAGGSPRSSDHRPN